MWIKLLYSVITVLFLALDCGAQAPQNNKNALISNNNIANNVFKLSYQKGWNFVCWYKDCIDWEANEDSIKRLKETGASHFVLVVNWYVSSVEDSFLRKNIPAQNFPGSSEHQTYSNEQIVKLLGWVSKYNLKIVIKPHVEIVDEGQTFRGKYKPNQPEVFYTRYLSYFKELLQTVQPFNKNITDIVVGTELTTLALDANQWRNVIHQIKEAAPAQAKFTFASNWFDFYLIDFWDELDWIGIDAYYPLSFIGTPDTDSMYKMWNVWGLMLSRWRDKHWPNKPIGYTETGFVDNKGSTRMSLRAWANQNEVDEDEHANAFAATLQLANKFENFYALYWWVWDIHSNNIPNNRSRYQTTGRKAEAVLKYYWNGKP